MKTLVFSLLSFILLLQLLLVIRITSVSGQCLESQKSLLLQLKEDLKFNSLESTKLVYWNQNTEDCCKWEGVICNTSSGHVIGLELDGESIYGGLNSTSSALYKFHFLQKLNLANSSFNSIQIPHGLFNLTSLTYLNLSDCGFSGQIPVGISRLKRLKILDLSTINSYLNGKSFLKIGRPNLKMIVQNLKELTELYFDGVNMKAQAKSWSQAISSSLPNLRVLSLAKTYISGPIDPSLQRLQFLSHIRLDGNNLNDKVPEFLANLTNLKVLRLSFCNLQGTFPKRIIQIPKLDVLDLSDNKKLQGSIPELPNNGSLHTLVLSLTNFSGTLPESIGNLELLSKMEIFNCTFSGIIPKSIGKLTRLVSFDIAYNNFTGHIPLFHNSRDLAYLDLSHNRLSGTIPSTYFVGFVNVVHVDMSFNMFIGKIPSSLFALPSLQKIMLSQNQFGGSLPSFSNASFFQLNTIDLSSNKLNGSIPMSLFELRGLNVLSLSSNRLTGSLQLEIIQKLENLFDLDLSYNNLLIETSCDSSTEPLHHQFNSLGLASCKLKCIPDLRNQSTLYKLDLSENQLGGAVPSWIWNIGNGSLVHLNLSQNQLVSLQEPYDMPGLSVLDLHSNQLTGKIPVPPESVSYVDYSANNFSSSVPPDVGKNLTFANFFSVSSNKLTGTIPDSICEAGYLQVLDMSNNFLSGAIPPCLLGWSESLAVLNLGNNNLTGHIDGTFVENCILRTLDLHGNHLEGNVPRSLSNCTRLEVLNLGNNQINDTFPCFFKNSFNLRVLVLRFNLFRGDIWCPQPSTLGPNLQIMDIASNYFTGKVPHNFFSNWTAMVGYKGDAQLEISQLRYRVFDLENFYYQDTVTVTQKGRELTLVKILTIFNSIDISCNQFEGNIPETMGNLRALFLLNLSHNALTGLIPSSLGNLKQLEALDLSVNKIAGNIPEELASLTFLSFLNLSYNQLIGKIPVVSQFSTFEEESFIGNKGLCGDPMKKTCVEAEADPPSGLGSNQHSGDKVDWDMIAAEVGFSVGLGIVIMPLIVYRRWRIFYYEHVDAVLSRILAMKNQRRSNHRQRRGNKTRRGTRSKLSSSYNAKNDT